MHNQTSSLSLSLSLSLSQILAGIFEKFKEKKLNVVTSLRDAADAVYLTVSGGVAHGCDFMTPLPPRPPWLIFKRM